MTACRVNRSPLSTEPDGRFLVITLILCVAQAMSTLEGPESNSSIQYNVSNLSATNWSACGFDDGGSNSTGNNNATSAPGSETNSSCPFTVNPSTTAPISTEPTSAPSNETNSTRLTVHPSTTAPVSLYNCSDPGHPYTDWLAWAVQHCDTSLPPSRNASCNTSDSANQTNQSFFSYCNGSTAAPLAPFRESILYLFSLPSVLAVTPIISVATTLDNASAFDRYGFASGLSAQLFNDWGLSPFTQVDSANVVQVTDCTVNVFSTYGSAPLPSTLCQSNTPCTASDPVCPTGIMSCVCPSPASWLPIDTTYNGSAAAQNSSARRAVSSSYYVQMQFVFRLDYADSFIPTTPEQVIDMLRISTVAALAEIQNATFGSLYDLAPQQFLSVNYAYGNSVLVDTATSSQGASSPNLSWLAVLVVVPVGGLLFSAVKIADWVKWKRYVRSLSINADHRDNPVLDNVREGLGRGEWIDAVAKGRHRSAREATYDDTGNCDAEDAGLGQFNLVV